MKRNGLHEPHLMLDEKNTAHLVERKANYYIVGC